MSSPLRAGGRWRQDEYGKRWRNALEITYTQFREGGVAAAGDEEALEVPSVLPAASPLSLTSLYTPFTSPPKWR